VAADVTKHIQLLPAKDLSAFYTFVKEQGVDNDANKAFTLEKGVLHVSGKQQGYLATRQEYANYRLVVEYKWGKASPDNDSAVFFHGVGPDKIWMQSIEAQVATKTATATGDLILIGGKATTLTVDGQRKEGGKIDRAGKKDYEKPAGEWNTMEILCSGDKVQIKVNGQVTAEGTGANLTAGKIFLQSNNGEIFFRKCELFPLK